MNSPTKNGNNFFDCCSDHSPPNSKYYTLNNVMTECTNKGGIKKEKITHPDLKSSFALPNNTNYEAIDSATCNVLPKCSSSTVGQLSPKSLTYQKTSMEQQLTNLKAALGPNFEQQLEKFRHKSNPIMSEEGQQYIKEYLHSQEYQDFFKGSRFLGNDMKRHLILQKNTLNKDKSSKTHEYKNEDTHKNNDQKATTKKANFVFNYPSCSSEYSKPPQPLELEEAEIVQLQQWLIKSLGEQYKSYKILLRKHLSGAIEQPEFETEITSLLNEEQLDKHNHLMVAILAKALTTRERRQQMIDFDLLTMYKIMQDEDSYIHRIVDKQLECTSSYTQSSPHETDQNNQKMSKGKKSVKNNKRFVSETSSEEESDEELQFELSDDDDDSSCEIIYSDDDDSDESSLAASNGRRSHTTSYSSGSNEPNKAIGRRKQRRNQSNVLQTTSESSSSTECIIKRNKQNKKYSAKLSNSSSACVSSEESQGYRKAGYSLRKRIPKTKHSSDEFTSGSEFKDVDLNKKKKISKLDHFSSSNEDESVNVKTKNKIRILSIDSDDS